MHIIKVSQRYLLHFISKCVLICCWDSECLCKDWVCTSQSSSHLENKFKKEMTLNLPFPPWTFEAESNPMTPGMNFVENTKYPKILSLWTSLEESFREITQKIWKMSVKINMPYELKWRAWVIRNLYTFEESRTNTIDCGNKMMYSRKH